ncbi:Dihydroneopterin aldolase [alpha proteobacterium BAL199]|jgi:7,8-dihydroneopterin aldolase/epimerase/oxygenase|nr:Dihydroneopterin aldolase [alpha proteobacterium BAL199]
MAPDDGRNAYQPDGEAERIAVSARADTGTIDDLYVVRVRGLVVDFRIGVYAHEQGVTQRVRIDLTVEVTRPDGGFQEDHRRVYCYDRLTKGIRKLAGGGHIRLVETLADRVAELALVDPRARRAEVTVEKLDIMPDAEGVGVTVSRSRQT